MKTLSLRAELFHADRQTDMAKLIVAFAVLRKPLKSTKTKVYLYRDIIQ